MKRTDRSATPKKTASAPTPIQISTGFVPRPGANSAYTSDVKPTTIRKAEPGVRKRARRDSGSVAPSRTAAIGGTRVARIAGRMLATTVTTIPTISETTTVRDAKTRPLFGSVKPTALKSPTSPFARARPRKRPAVAASVPTTTDSRRIDQSTCRREAPSVRMVANSRVRWAIVIESEFAITKLPTKSEIPAKTSRKMRRNLMNVFVPEASS